MIRNYPVLYPVGSDLLCPSARARQSTAISCPAPSGSCIENRCYAPFQKLPCDASILMLRSLGADTDFKARRKMSHANRAFGLVAMLPSGAGTPEGFCYQISIL